jgi:hypothetical protein
MSAHSTYSLLVFDLHEAFDSIPWILFYWIFFAFQFFVYGQLMAALVTRLDGYLFYYGTGLLIIILFDTASWAGRSFVESAHEGRLKYLLSLPIERSRLMLERLALGVVVSLFRLIPPLIVILWLQGLLTPAVLVTAVVEVALLGVGIIGLMVALSFIAFKSFDIYSAVVAGMSALLIRFSTIYYPLGYMPPVIADVSLGNPMTYGTDLLRSVLGFSPSVLLDPYVSVTVVVALAVVALCAGTLTISRVVEGVKSS